LDSHDQEVTWPGSRVVVEHVSRSYDDAFVLRDVSFEVASGELIALTGPSGSGKTTLLQLIGSLDRPTSGSIHVDDTAIEKLKRAARFRRDVVGFVFQLHHLLPSLSVQQNVELPLIAGHVPKHQRNERALQLLAEVGLADRAKNLPSDLSGGERQRVAVARALAGRPTLLLADEPTGALDSVASELIWQLLLDVRQNYGTTIIVASHDVTLLERADRELKLIDGRLAADRRPVAREQAA
jgi:putative ABC transport system ATP-binding protein